MTERTCSKCGKEVAADRHFCGGCGQPVAAVDTAASDKPAPRFCANCGASYLPGKRFCQQCGRALGTAAPNPAPAVQVEPAAATVPLPEPVSSTVVLETDAQVRSETAALLCSNCGAPYTPGRRFCRQCGQAIGTTVQEAPVEPVHIEQAQPMAPPIMTNDDVTTLATPTISVPPAPPEPAALLCGNCGAPYSPGKRFCKKCGQAVSSNAPGAPIQPIRSEQAAPTALAIPASDESSTQTAKEFSVPAQTEPEAFLCGNCGAPYSPGKRFCKQCGKAVVTTAPDAPPTEPIHIEQAAPTAPAVKVIEEDPTLAVPTVPIPTVADDHSLIEENGPPATETTVAVLGSATRALPPLESAPPELSLFTPIDPAPPTIPPDLPLQAKPQTDPDQNLGRTVQDQPEPSLNEDEFRPQFRFSGVEEEPVPILQLEASPEANNAHKMSFGGYASIESDDAADPDRSDSSARRRRMLLLVLGVVCAIAMLGAAGYFTTSYYRKHRSAPIETQLTPATALAPIPAAKPPEPAQPKTIVASTPATPAKPSPQKQEASAHETPSKPNAADSRPNAQRKLESTCSLDSGMLSKMLDQADRNRQQGNYPDAARQYRTVLDCDHNNARAHSGLELTLLAIQHQ